MRRIVLAAAASLLLVVRSLTQDFGFTAIPGGPGGPALVGLTNLGVTGAATTTGLQNTTLGNSSPLNINDIASGDFNADGIGDIAVAQGSARRRRSRAYRRSSSRRFARRCSPRR